jgi:uncharacterized protein involved in outer membrane biogenesis
MKKIITRLLLLLILLIILAALAAHFFLDGEVKRLVESIGPQLTKVSVKLERVNLMLLSGSGKLTGLVVGNPEGYKSPSAISSRSISLSLKPSSLLDDKIVIRSINLQGPEVTFETDLTQNNLGKILSNLDESTGGGKEPKETPKEPAAKKKLEVDDFLITGAKLHVVVSSLGGKSATVALPEIHLKDLGTSPEGITPAELSRVVLKQLEASAAKAAEGAIVDLSKGAVYLGGETSKVVPTNAVDKVTKGIGNLFKGK